MWIRAVAIGALALACAALGACGDDEGPNEKRFDGDSADVAAVVDRLQDYAREGEGSKICSELMTPQLARFIASSYDKGCAERVASQLAGDGTTITVRRLQVQGPLASATVVEANRNVTGLAFVKSDGKWRISRIRG
jgi:hypothetical protein